MNQFLVSFHYCTKSRQQMFSIIATRLLIEQRIWTEGK